MGDLRTYKIKWLMRKLNMGKHALFKRGRVTQKRRTIRRLMLIFSRRDGAK